MSTLHERVQQAVTTWAKEYFSTDEIVIYIFDDEDEDPSRYIAVIAVRELDVWQAAEAWEEGGEIVSINHLGEGAPLDDVVWPWPD